MRGAFAMDYWTVRGGNRLEGSCRVQGSKNASLPILAASILAPLQCELHNVPQLRDVDAALRILRHLGCRAEQRGNEVYIDSTGLSGCSIPHHLMDFLDPKEGFSVSQYVELAHKAAAEITVFVFLERKNPSPFKLTFCSKGLNFTKLHFLGGSFFTLGINGNANQQQYNNQHRNNKVLHS
jgi:hypothetical protein